ncbi:MAG: 2Fe-2S iron-sulfur cluster-binding protein [Polyangiaceae bacterium]
MVAKLRVQGSDAIIDAHEGEDLLTTLQAHDVPIATSCGGVATCGTCRIVVIRGAENLTPIRPQELVHLGNVAKITGQRLACQSKICGDGEIVIDIPPVERTEIKRARKTSRTARDHASQRGAIEWRPRLLDKKKDEP